VHRTRVRLCAHPYALPLVLNRSHRLAQHSSYELCHHAPRVHFEVAPPNCILFEAPSSYGLVARRQTNRRYVVLSVGILLYVIIFTIVMDRGFLKTARAERSPPFPLPQCFCYAFVFPPSLLSLLHDGS
jgi:hypothetical protein